MLRGLAEVSSVGRQDVWVFSNNAVYVVKRVLGTRTLFQLTVCMLSLFFYRTAATFFYAKLAA